MNRSETEPTVPARRRIDFANGGWLCVEPLWPLEKAFDAVTGEDRRRAAEFASARRRQEFLSWRALLYRELGRTVRIEYDPVGAPYPVDFQGYIGVSHSRTQAAVCWSPAGPCAVDIESAGRDFTNVRRRCLAPDEEALGRHEAWPCIAWCAKECLYKLAGERNIDLKDDLRLMEMQAEKDLQGGTVAGSAKGRIHRLRFARFGSDWAVWKE